MKNIFTLTTIIWLVSYTSSMGQCLEYKTISTNPNNPINTELPASKARYLNQFNWAKTTSHNSVAVIPINSAANLFKAFPKYQTLEKL
jgi:hypothetical protein